MAQRDLSMPVHGNAGRVGFIDLWVVYTDPRAEGVSR